LPATPARAVTSRVQSPRGLDVDLFLRDYWQKRPLLLRGAFPGFEGLFTVEQLLAHCVRDETPSRFVSEEAGMVHGPFELDLEELPKEGWTVLVQSLETVSADAWALLDSFSFLPRARLDDLMVSYATPGGGIGPHFDLYDVFLVQGTGRRRWRYTDAPLNDAKDEDASGHFVFEADHDVEVGPGDLLYLPPRVPHDGSAITTCTTYSVGGATPRHEDLVAEFFSLLSAEPEISGLELTGMYTDPNAAPPTRRGEVPQRLRDETLALLRRDRFDESAVSTFLGRLLTGPKPHTTFEPGEELTAAELSGRLAQPGTLRLQPATRMLHDGGRRVFLNGVTFDVAADPPLLALADDRAVPLPCTFSDEAIELLRDWMEEGSVIVEP